MKRDQDRKEIVCFKGSPAGKTPGARAVGFGVCIQCARGGCACYFRNIGGAPTYRALASACSPAPTILN